MPKSAKTSRRGEGGGVSRSVTVGGSSRISYRASPDRARAETCDRGSDRGSGCECEFTTFFVAETIPHRRRHFQGGVPPTQPIGVPLPPPNRQKSDLKQGRALPAAFGATRYLGLFGGPEGSSHHREKGRC
jgi:hypothetical protein